MNSYEIDYKIYGDSLQSVEVTPDPGETVVAEAGTMVMARAGLRLRNQTGRRQPGERRRVQTRREHRQMVPDRREPVFGAFHKQRRWTVRSDFPGLREFNRRLTMRR